MFPMVVENPETVVLLHGIGHSMLNMLLLEKSLKKAGYRTLNISYPSLRHDIQYLSKWLSEKLAKEQVWQESARVHFVAHSMGGLVSGFYLQDFEAEIPASKLGRVVMLGTPHGGSQVADGLKNFWIYKRIFGPAGQELTTDERSGNQVQPRYELGIIAGTQNWLYPLGKIFITQPHDGCVSVESTKVEGMKDHITLPVLHGIMGWSPKVQAQVLAFLKNGGFDYPD